MLDREKTLLNADLPAAAAAVAGGALCARLGSRTTASAALHPGGHVDIDRIAGHSLLQRQGQLIPQVGPAKNLGTPATARVAEDIPENVSEYVAERF